MLNIQLNLPEPLEEVLNEISRSKFNGDISRTVVELLKNELETLRRIKQQKLQSLRSQAVDAFIKETKEQLSALHPDDKWNERLTVQEYFDLSEDEWLQEWKKCSANAHKILEDKEEIDVPADFVPAGQRSS